jgi:RNA polymerase sigma-70 factor (ECF subfamily)
MTIPREPDTEQLLDRVADGDRAAPGLLLERHRDRLRHMVALRLDPRLRRRIDPSDVVQESLVEAAAKLSDFARRRPLPFYAWLRQIAWEALVRLHRRHVRAGRRSVRREREEVPGLSDESAHELAARLAGHAGSPSAGLIPSCGDLLPSPAGIAEVSAGPDGKESRQLGMRRAELRDRLHAALAQLGEADREVLVLRYLEDLSTRELAAVLGLGESAVKMRQLRALRRLRDLLGDDLAEDLP